MWDSNTCETKQACLHTLPHVCLHTLCTKWETAISYYMDFSSVQWNNIQDESWEMWSTWPLIWVNVICLNRDTEAHVGDRHWLVGPLQQDLCVLKKKLVLMFVLQDKQETLLILFCCTCLFPHTTRMSFLLICGLWNHCPLPCSLLGTRGIWVWMEKFFLVWYPLCTHAKEHPLLFY